MHTNVAPHDIAAEQAALGAMLASPQACDVVMDIVENKDFYRDSHRTIFNKAASIRLSGEEPDALSVAAAMTQEELDSVGGREYIFTLAEYVPSSANASQYANIVSSTAIRRSIIKSAYEVAQIAYDTVDAEEVIDEMEKRMLSISDVASAEAPENMVSMVQAAEKRIQNSANGIRTCGHPTHITGLNHLIGGLEPGACVVLAARPGQGKSALAMNIASHVAIDKHVVFYSAEMSKEELIDRMLASESQIGLSKLRAGELSEDEARKMMNAARLMTSMKLSIDDSCSTMGDIVRKTRRLASKQELGLVVIDYLQLLQMGKTSKTESRVLEIGAMTRAVKLMAREHKIPVLLLSQLNRPDQRYQSEDGKQQRPTLASLRDSGSIEQDADSVLFIYWQRQDNPDNVQLIVEKNRNGATGIVKLKYIPHTLTFIETL